VVDVEESVGPELAAVRAARERRDALRHRIMPLVLVGIIAVVLLSARSHPRIGLHGESLALTIALVGLIAGFTGVRQTLLMGRRPSRVSWLWLGLLVASSLTMLWLQPSGPGVYGLLVCTVAVSIRVVPSRIVVIMLLVGCLIALMAIEVTHGHLEHLTRAQAIGNLISVAVLFVVAFMVGRSRLRDDQLEESMLRLEQARASQLRAAALGERQRLAREMHDVLAHSLSGLVMQLEGVRLMAVTNPSDDRLVGAVDRAHQLAKNGLDEARQAIGMLRDDDLPGPAELTGAFEADTGVPCRFTVCGSPRDLPSPVRLALYRVAQEALTNIRKHAHPDRVDIRLEYLPDEVLLSVDDVGSAGAPSAAVPGGGYGLTGMRERAELLGGTLTAGPTAAGFVVSLRVPA
jgi:signal transduction histidine kinase